MKKICTLLVIAFIYLNPLNLHAEPSYVDLVYKNTLSALPKDSSWIKKLFSTQERKVFLVVSISKKNGGATNDSVLLIPPTILESFERINGELKRTKSENLDLLSSQFVNDFEQLRIKVEFFSVNKSKANAFAESLKSLSAAYISTGATPQASQVVTSAMDAIGSVLFENKDIYLSYVGGIPASSDNNTITLITLYFDESGNINDSAFANTDVSKRVVFQVNSTANFAVNFQFSFENQGVNQTEKEFFSRLSSSQSPSDKRDACRALRKTLKKRFSESTTSDLIAIAVNDINWLQDETTYSCINPTEAVKYKREHGLKYLANCTSDECTNTKSILFLLDGNASAEDINAIAKKDFYNVDYKVTQKCTRLSDWSDIRSRFESQSLKTFMVKSCLTTDSGRHPYTHTFSWIAAGSLASHSCDKNDEDNYCN